MSSKTKYTHLTKDERCLIHKLKTDGKFQKTIAKELSRSESTISTELKRNKSKCGYDPYSADMKSKSRRKNQNRGKIANNPALKKYIVDCLSTGYMGPDVISGNMKLNSLPNRVSGETIYRYIYNNPTAKEEKLYQLLAYKRCQRHPHGTRKKQGKHCIPNRVSISNRDAVAKDRTEVGHFEGDLTFHKGNQSMNIGSMVDKASQKIFLTLNKSKKTRTVISNMLSRLIEIPGNLRKSITFDNGKEFCGHTNLQLTGIKTYFCAPYSPQQKPLVEKMNSMIHRIFPKKIDIKTLTKKALMEIENVLNNMPRKSLGYKTPNQVWNELAKV